jgi:Tfp pilus assembly protein PilF
VTLNITVATRKVIYQMGDFRLTNTISGKYEDRTAQKQVQVQKFDWSALVSFAGVGSVGNLNVSDWLAEQIGKIPADGSVERLITLLLEADRWLQTTPAKHRWHTFTIGAFVGSRPLTAMVSNFQSIDGRQESSPRRMLFVTRRRPTHPLVILAGQGAASVTEQDRLRLIGLVRSNAPPQTVHNALAELNERIAALDSSVSPGCFTSHLTIDGKSEGTPHGIDPQQEYLPEFALEDLKKLGLTLKPAIDEAGRPKPIQLVGMTGVRSPSSEQEFQARLKENPKDPELLNNYGAFLKDTKRDARRAEEYYRLSLAQNPKHALALSNLANIFWERKEYDEAERLYAQAFDFGSDNIVVVVNYANFLTEVRQDFAKAKQLYQRALEQDPKNAYALGWYANFLFRSHADHNTVQEAYDRVFEIAPNHPTFRGNYANFLRDAQQDYERAAQEYRKALEQEPNNEANLSNYLQLRLTFAVNYTEAADLCRKLLKLRPEDATLLDAYAVCLSRLDAPAAEVEKYYRAAISASPTYPNAMANLAQHLWVQRRDAEALELSRECLALEPNDVVAVEVWLYLYAHSTDSRSEALRALKSLLERGARSPGWDFSRNIERATQDGHPDLALVRDLASVVAQEQSMDALNQYSIWRNLA